MSRFRPTRRIVLARLLTGISTLALASLLSAATQLSAQDRLVQDGRNLFTRTFKVSEGFGYRLGQPELVLFERQLGPDAKTCLECHNLGGVGGGAGNRKNVWVGIDPGLERRIERANIRNSTALWGGGAVQALAQEMSTELQSQRQQEKERARATGEAVTVDLASKGIAFGQLTALPLGDLDLTRLEGVDRDLVIRPFHAKGTRGTIRRFTQEAVWRHHGLESPELLKRRYPLQGNWAQYDHDEDGVVNEFSTRQITALSAFQAVLPTPQLVLPQDPIRRAQVRRGGQWFEANCATCHVSHLALTKPEVTIESAMGEPAPTLDLLKGYAGLPPVLQREDGKVKVALYSDLKRHDLGAGLAEANGQLSDDKVTGVGPSVFITTKLWGVADAPPYLHDGRAHTLPAAIVAHGGEAAAASKAFQALEPKEQEDLVLFLQSLKAPQLSRN
ncbi:di-heme oxidoredictase family protein [Candidatus Cyanaurora vandensis]|uniref:di-heme oxidoredictase family protein n=1 Tax=Candidatus Cyanaurora vandensis TaxID=2714958 RepID=UPI002580D43B|nr:di-heme oxidoredictase family protein [Candidatus Cyanaurora vandensis]